MRLATYVESFVPHIWICLIKDSYMRHKRFDIKDSYMNRDIKDQVLIYDSFIYEARDICRIVCASYMNLRHKRFIYEAFISEACVSHTAYMNDSCQKVLHKRSSIYEACDTKIFVKNQKSHHCSLLSLLQKRPMGWLWLVGSIKL